jgi:metal-responsive CopG/Arc/MetJ family transcriptional regulator
MNDEVVGVRLPKEELAAVDKCVSKGHAINRSDFIRSAVREALKTCREAQKA